MISQCCSALFIHSFLFNLGPQYISIRNHNARYYAVNISPRNIVDWFPDVIILEEEVLSVVCYQTSGPCTHLPAHHRL